MIEFSNITKIYASSHIALNHINLTIPTGEMVFLVGHSGAGKSTLLKLLMGIENPTQGNLFVDQQNISRIKPKNISSLRKKMSMVFQDPQLLSERTVFENIALPLVINRFKPEEISKRVRAVLHKVGLDRKERLYPMALSYGEQQRVGIARALVSTPAYILADEPTGNLDPELSLSIMRLFESFHQLGVTVIIATHNLPLVAAFRHRIITLKSGQVAGDTAYASEKYAVSETV